ncbi:hypothetical protein [Azospirillum picis]|uniref:Cell division protein FtsB n=1 Tax=Azospirillum picis TaxID=488438 RepID=A0ABU0MKD1_9PROT|nr:hypothetical protein [Azospirillum picis]MBP2300239.1 cell division protein FtsB [Azospirillum picis]MDQ0533919.1 cell division protein FtsB [Azospirillum picis]
MTAELLLALFCIGATLLFLGLRRALIHRTEQAVRRAGVTLLAERDALEARANELEAMQAEIEALRAKLAELSAHRLVLSRRGSRRVTASRRFIHEIGRPEPGRHRFTFRLRMLPGYGDRAEAKAVLHPAIWRFENEALVWSADFAAAQMLTRSIFHEAVGVGVTAPAPTGNAAEAEAAAP